MIYIQKNSDNLPHHFDCACAMYGAIETGQSYKLVSFEDVNSGKYDNLIKLHLFVGSVEFMKCVFSRIGLNKIKLPRNSNRQFEIKNLSEAKEISKTKSIFIKPVDIKLFTGFVLDQMVYESINNISLDTLVYVYDVLPDIISEYRCYVKYGEVIDIRHYSGDIFVYPNKEYLDKILKENKDFPNSYTIDIGILKDNTNCVIEFNDMWAIGNYGIPNDIYLRLLKLRYFEIISSLH